MASSGSGYDLSASTFSPDGRIFQVEYASKAVEQQGSTIIGICCTEGVVIGTSKAILHKMVVPNTCSYKRIHTIDTHVGMVSTGFVPDARVLVSRAIDEAADYKDQYGVPIPPHVLAERLGLYAHYFTLHGALRPFGAACLTAAYDEELDKHRLFLLEPNGAAYAYQAAATGKNKQAAKTELEKLVKHDVNLSAEQAVKEIVKILTLLHNENSENEGKPLELEVSWITSQTKNQHVPVSVEMIKQAREWANEQLEEEEDDEEEEEMQEG